MTQSVLQQAWNGTEDHTLPIMVERHRAQIDALRNNISTAPAGHRSSANSQIRTPRASLGARSGTPRAKPWVIAFE